MPGGSSASLRGYARFREGVDPERRPQWVGPSALERRSRTMKPAAHAAGNQGPTMARAAGFAAADAGWDPPDGFRLGRSLTRRPPEISSPMARVGLKRKCYITGTAGQA